MNREQIEKLAMDSAAGQLNEDVDALLQEYLAEHTEANRWFQEMQEIYENTQVAFDTKTDFIKQPVQNKVTHKMNWFSILRWAAVIVIAVCVGAAAGRWSKPTILQKPPSIKTSANSTVKQSGITPDNVLANLDDGFWRDKISALINPSTVKIRREKSSDLSLWEQYRLYKGEQL